MPDSTDTLKPTGDLGEDDTDCAYRDAYPAGALRRLQHRELDLLKEIDRICKAHDLTYFLESGTCIGAMRHDGFIPWDDDMDIGMPLDDYERFCDIAPEELPEGLVLHLPGNTAGFAPLFAKLCDDRTRYASRQVFESGAKTGIFIDIFPFCRLSDDPQTALRQCRKASRIQKISYLYHSAHPKIPQDSTLRGLKSAACVLAHGVLRVGYTPARIQERFKAIFPLNTSASPRSSGNWVSACYTDWGAIPATALFHTVEHVFEDARFPIPADADAYLTIFYGDWHSLPPKDQRSATPPVILDFGDGINVMEAGRGGMDAPLQ